MGCIIFIQFAFADEHSILQDRINKANGVPKIELLNQLSDSLLSINPRTSKEFATSALEESVKNKNDKYSAISLYNIAYANYYLGDFAQGIANLNESLKFSKKLNNIEFQIDALTLQGIMQKSSNLYFEATKTYEIALELCIKLNNHSQTARILNNLGNVFEAQGDYDSAVKNYLRALRYYNPNIDSLDFALGYINLGKMFFNLENYLQAKEFFQTALKFSNNRMLNEQAIINNCMGSIYFTQNNMEAALMLFNKALTFSESINDKRNYAIILNNIAEVHRTRGNYSDALKYYEQAQEINLKYHYNFGATNIEINLAHLYMLQKDMPRAKAKLDLAHSMIDKYNFKSLKLELFDKYAKFYNFKGDLKTALFYKDEYIKLKDTISYIDRNRKLTSLVAKFSMEDKDKQIEGYAAEKRILDLELTQKRILIALLVLAILFFIALLWFFYTKNKVITKHEKELEAKNEDLKLANENLEIVKNNLEVSYSREKEVTEMNKNIIDLISHNIKIPFTIIKSAAELTAMNLEMGKVDRANTNISKITRTIDNLTRFTNELLDISKNEGVKLNDNITSIDICEYVVNLVNNEFMDTIDHKHNFIFKFPEKPIILYVSLKVLDHIFHNLLSNAVKYSEKNTDITIELSENYASLKCSIKDEGRGIPIEEQDKLFKKYHRFSNTDGVEGSGIGLYLVKRVITELNGDIEVISAVKVGTTINFSFPLDTRVH